jgi:hypothetical protein
MLNIAKELEKFLADQNLKIKPEWLDHIELNEQEELYLKSVKIRRVAELSRVLARKSIEQHVSNIRMEL